MDSATINTISLCSGVGMLDEGLHAGFEYLGIRSRTILFAEREAYPVAVLVARMEEGSIPAAPIWFGDFTELPARDFRGKVDCIVAGFPCQDLSVAGKRVGLDGKRSGLFFEVVRIATDSDAWCMLLENVAGISSATASTVDEESASEYVGNYHAKGFSQVGVEDGRLLERAAARVVGELADCGWNAEWIVVSASDVGASHGRARWFCFAWRNVADAEGLGRGQRQRDELARRTEAEGAGQSIADAARHVGDRSGDGQSGSWRGICEAGDAMEFSARDGWNEGWAEPAREQGRSDAAEHGGAMADSKNADRWSELQPEGARCRWSRFARGSEPMADASGTRSQRHKQSSTHEPDGRTDARTMPISYRISS